MTSSSIVGIVFGQADSSTGALSGPLASEVGLLLLVGAVGFLSGLSMRWLWRCIKMLVLVALVTAVVLWVVGVGPPTVTARNGLAPSDPGASEMVGALLATPLRAGISAVGFILGLLASRNAKTQRNCE